MRRNGGTPSTGNGLPVLMSQAMKTERTMTKKEMKIERAEIEALIGDLAGDLSKLGARIEADELIAHLLDRGGYRGQALRDRRQEMDAIADRQIDRLWAPVPEHPRGLFLAALAEAVECGDRERALLAVSYLITAAAGDDVGSDAHLGALDALAEVGSARAIRDYSERVHRGETTSTVGHFRIATRIATGS